MELDEKYVLPLTIEEDPSYVQNKYKGRYKALLGVNLFNDYSGTYNTTLMNIYIEGTTTDPAKVDTRLARVVDENTISSMPVQRGWKMRTAPGIKYSSSLKKERRTRKVLLKES